MTSFLDSITRPAMILDPDKCRRNIRAMAEKAKRNNVVFRPHFKTHQSLLVGRWFRDYGVDRIAVSSLTMADFFAHDGWNDIMVAFPVNVREMPMINALAGKLNLGLLIADASIPSLLTAELANKVDVYLKIDVGSHRTGFNPAQKELIAGVIKDCVSHPLLTFKGFVAHAGHTYQTQSLLEVQKIFNQGISLMQELKDYFSPQYPDIMVSWGDTPTCSLAEMFPGIDEIRPGNFVFYDLTQFHLGSCDWEHIALAVAAPVAARHADRGEVLLYAGAVHLSKDVFGLPGGESVYGEVVRLTAKGWEPYHKPLYIEKISQEHGLFSCPEELWDDFIPGTLVGIVPVHACLTANLMKDFYDLEGIRLEL